MSEEKLTLKAQRAPDDQSYIYKNVDRHWVNSRPDYALVLISTLDPDVHFRNPDDPLLWLMKKLPNGEVLLCDSMPGPDIELAKFPDRTLTQWVAEWIIRNDGRIEGYPVFDKEDVNPGIREEVWDLVVAKRASETPKQSNTLDS